MDINTIITHLKNFSDTWNGWDKVITGLYRFNPFYKNDKAHIPGIAEADFGETVRGAWNGVFNVGTGSYNKLFK